MTADERAPEPQPVEDTEPGPPPEALHASSGAVIVTPHGGTQ